MSKAAFERILVAYDGSDYALRACESAAAIAESFSSEVSLLYVIPTLSIYTAPMADQYYAVQRTAAEESVRKCQKAFKSRGVRVSDDIVPARWSVVETIVDYAVDKEIDLILMGARGAGGFEKLLVGSVASGVVAHAACPVLIVR